MRVEEGEAEQHQMQGIRQNTMALSAGENKSLHTGGEMELLLLYEMERKMLILGFISLELKLGNERQLVLLDDI